MLKLIAKLFSLVLGLPAIMGGADTSFATGATETVKRWAARLWVELPREIYFGKYMTVCGYCLMPDGCDALLLDHAACLTVRTETPEVGRTAAIRWTRRFSSPALPKAGSVQRASAGWRQAARGVFR